MLLVHSHHARARAQQRGVPRLIQSWLLEYGEEFFDGRGGIIRYFTRQGIRRMKRDIGTTPLKRLSEFLRCYLVESNDDGSIITMGKRYPNKRLPRH